MPRASRKPAPAVAVEIEPPGTVICEGIVEGRPVPWRAPTLGRNGGCVRNRSYVAYKAWQQTVALFARQAMGRRRPYGGPVALHVTFTLTPRPGTPPDLTNLLKAFEDSLQGVCIRNDTQVVGTVATRIVSSQEPERAGFVVFAAKKGGVDAKDIA